MDYAKIISIEFNIMYTYAQNIINLLDEGATVPFIARYRKEMTGSCDDQILRNICDRLEYLRSLNKRKEEIIKLITEQGNMTDEIFKSIESAITLTELEDIYRPFKPKRQTRATIAVAKGLQSLADRIMSQADKTGDRMAICNEFVNEEKGVMSSEEALKGALDIIAEAISDDAICRKKLRTYIFDTSFIYTELKPGDNFKTYEMYADYKEQVAKMASHRVLAINRGEKEDCLKVVIKPNEAKCLQLIEDLFLKNECIWTQDLLSTIADSFDRLIFPSIEREIRTLLTDNACEQAIKMFEVNLKPLLMQPPLKYKNILGFDPAYRTGCKLAVIDENGKCLTTSVIYPTPPHSDIENSEKKMVELIAKYKVKAIAIGNGTASKESEIFVSNLLKKLPVKVEYMVVNEAGASVYSASKLGAEEFPEYDVSLRSAVSIARRLQDPLAELIKIDVKSIGVGQYQHDMPQKRLTQVLEGVVEDSVNSVGVDLNTASISLLSFVSGLNKSIAKNITDYRGSNGKFSERKELKKVNKLGDKAYEQCAGFLRIHDGKHILDNTAVHPESYAAVKKLLALFNLKEEDIASNNIKLLPTLIEQKGKNSVAQAIGIGVPTLDDIVEELQKPGRDIRDELPPPMLKSDLMDIKDLKEGMVLDGTVRNVIDFGAFIDIGVHQDGLVHISEISKEYIKHPSEVLTVGQIIKVKVIGVDLQKNRIQLSIKKLED